LSVDGDSYYEKNFAQDIRRGHLLYNHYLIYTNSYSAGLANGTEGEYNRHSDSATNAPNGSYKILEDNYYYIIWLCYTYYTDIYTPNGYHESINHAQILYNYWLKYTDTKNDVDWNVENQQVGTFGESTFVGGTFGSGSSAYPLYFRNVLYGIVYLT